MKLYLSFISCLCLFNVLSGQIGDSIGLNLAVDNYTQFDMEILQGQNPLSIGVRNFDLSYEGIKGTPWLYDEYEKVILSIDNGKEHVKTNAEVFLDISKHEVIAKIPGNQYLTLTGEQVQSIYFSKSGRKFKAFTQAELSDRVTTYTFGELLVEGEISFIKVIDKTFRKADYSSSYGSTGNRYDEFILKERYWLKTKNTSFKRTKLNKKSILKLLPKRESAIKAIIKKEKLGLNSTSDFITLIKLLNT